MVEQMLEDLPPVTLPDDKMMTIDLSNFAEFSEQTLKLEPWMLSFSNDYIADREPEIEIESWMLTFSQDYLARNEIEKIGSEVIPSKYRYKIHFFMFRKL